MKKTYVAYGKTAKQRDFLTHLFARLASIPSLEGLKNREKRALVKDAKRAGIGDSLLDEFSTVSSKDGNAEQAWGIEGLTPRAWLSLYEAHPHARKLLDLLTSKRSVSFPPLPQRNLSFFLDRTTSVVLSGSERRTGGDELLEEFIFSLRQYPFPYQLCPWCKVVVFAWQNGPGRPRKYCSGSCKSQASEYERKGTRREYMAKKRARAEVRAKAALKNEKNAAALL